MCIRDRIDPGDPTDVDFYEADEATLKNIPTVASSLSDALDALENDNDFLCEGGAFSRDQLEGYVELKREEVTKLNNTPHPVEFDMYYST